MTDPAGPEKQATDQEARFFFAVLKHMKSKPDTDWEAVAQELNYSNANTAQVRFGQIRKKLGLTFDKTPTPSVTKVVKQRTPKNIGGKAKGSHKTTATAKASAKSTADKKKSEMKHPVHQSETKNHEIKDEDHMDHEYIDITTI